MTEAVIVDAVRTPIGRRNGGLSTVHPAELLATVQGGLVGRVVDRLGKGVRSAPRDRLIHGLISYSMP